MSQELFACVRVAEFPSQALLRLRPDLRAVPMAVLEGRAPLEQVCSMNRQARLQGAAIGMTRLEAVALTRQNGKLRLLVRSLQSEAGAHTVLLECLAGFSPRIEEASRGTVCTFVLDIAGTERLFGLPRQLAERIRSALSTIGFRASIAVSSNFHSARVLAAASRSITVIPEGEEAQALAKLPLRFLEITEECAETLANWGIRTLGELAELPAVDLIARLGQSANSVRNLALGVHKHVFLPIETAFLLQEFYEFETPVEQVDSLLFIGARMIDSLVLRAVTRALALASFDLELHLEGGHTHRLAIHPALPSVDRKFLLKLMQLEIAAHPPFLAVLSLKLTAEAGQSSKVQLGLFAPQLPEPSRLDITIARLKGIVGEDRVGSPVLEDTHCADSFHISSFTAANHSDERKYGKQCMALRRVRPPLIVRVAVSSGNPSIIHDRQQSYKVTASFGPWRSSGCWWSVKSWDNDEWDVLAESSGGNALVCLLVNDRKKHEWRLEAFYD